ncbi:MAG TPA: hypothetical protein VMX36_03210 [Sedimentisphaerales bacterium]|nr:hypothetical protein [Sedimentisphaerales bacterium]
MTFKQRFCCPPVVLTVSAMSLLFAVTCNLQAAQSPSISLVTDTQMGPAARHGVSKVRLALRAKGIKIEQTTSLETARGDLLLVLGLSREAGAAATLHSSLDIPRPVEAESLLIRHVKWSDKKMLLVSGADDRGLMYALLDVADRIGWAEDPKNPLSEVHNIEEKPAVSERALSIYTMHQGNFESYFYDETYWERYLDMLAKNRFNTFALLFGYENWGYFSPPYPYFFDIEKFPNVKVIGITEDKQRKNLEALNRIIDMTHDRGMDFTLGIWDHIYRGGVQGPKDRAGKPTEGIVWGVTADNLTAYTRLALTKFLKLVPDMNAIQFRMHGESGLKRNEMGGFWENIYNVMNEHAPNVRFDARAKNFPDSLIDKAVAMNVNMRICTKYWMEQMGLPFHPTHIHPDNQHDRRHGYADLLSYPQRYKMHWRLWTGGTTRVLLWGDPEYVRRFAESTHLYDGEGFEVTEPMATKMQDHPHEMEPFELLKPEYQYYDWEFERYWHFFQVFGRVGYNPRTPGEVWGREFQRRFGKEAGVCVERAIHRASKILPRIVAYTYPYDMFPTTRGWVGKQRMKDLPEYAKALPSDTQQFLSIDDAAKNRLEGIDSAQFSPEESSRWFARISKDVLSLVEQAEQQIGEHRNKEFDSTIVDMKILAYLALYHSDRAKAGLSYALFIHSGDVNALDNAIKLEEEAIIAWGKLVESAGDIYHENLMMGRASANLTGHWRDELPKLNAGLDKLREQRKSFKPRVTESKITIAHVPIRKVQPGRKLAISSTIGAREPVSVARVGYRSGQGDYVWVDMKQTEPSIYRATIKARDVTAGLNYVIEASRGGEHTKTGSIAVAVTADDKAPHVKHEHVAHAPAGKPLTITAQVRDAAGVKWVRLRYRSVTQFQDYKTLEMTASGAGDEYKAVIPGRDIDAKWDFMYLIEVMDNNGNGAIYPDMETETPYIVVKLDR